MAGTEPSELEDLQHGADSHQATFQFPTDNSQAANESFMDIKLELGSEIPAGSTAEHATEAPRAPNHAYSNESLDNLHQHQPTDEDQMVVGLVSFQAAAMGAPISTEVTNTDPAVAEATFPPAVASAVAADASAAYATFANVEATAQDATFANVATIAMDGSCTKAHARMADAQDATFANAATTAADATFTNAATFAAEVRFADHDATAAVSDCAADAATTSPPAQDMAGVSQHTEQNDGAAAFDLPFDMEGGTASGGVNHTTSNSQLTPNGHVMETIMAHGPHDADAVPGIPGAGTVSDTHAAVAVSDTHVLGTVLEAHAVSTTPDTNAPRMGMLESDLPAVLDSIAIQPGPTLPEHPPSNTLSEAFVPSSAAPNGMHEALNTFDQARETHSAEAAYLPGSGIATPTGSATPNETLKNVRLGRVIAGPRHSPASDSKQPAGAGPRYVTRVISSPHKRVSTTPRASALASEPASAAETEQEQALGQFAASSALADIAAPNGAANVSADSGMVDAAAPNGMAGGVSEHGMMMSQPWQQAVEAIGPEAMQVDHAATALGVPSGGMTGQEALQHWQAITQQAIAQQAGVPDPVTGLVQATQPIADGGHDPATAAGQHSDPSQAAADAQQAQQALLEALQRASHLAYGPAGTVDANQYPEGMAIPTQDQNTAAAAAGIPAMYRVVGLSPDVMQYAAMPATTVSEGGEQVVVTDAQQQELMNAAAYQQAYLHQQWLANGGAPIYLQNAQEALTPEALAQQQQHWLRICNGQVDDGQGQMQQPSMGQEQMDTSAATAAATHGAGPAAGVGASTDANGDPRPAATSPSKRVTGLKRPPRVDVVYNHIPPEPQGLFSPDGYSLSQPPSGQVTPAGTTPASSAAPFVSMAQMAPAAVAAAGQDDDPNWATRKWQKVSRSAQPRQRGVAVSPDAYHMGGDQAVQGDASASQQPSTQEQYDAHQQQQAMDMAQQAALQGAVGMGLYTVDGMVLSPHMAEIPHSAGMPPGAQPQSMVTSAHEEPSQPIDPSQGAHTDSSTHPSSVVLATSTPWIAIRNPANGAEMLPPQLRFAAPGVQGPYMTGGGHVDGREGGVSAVSEGGVAVCVAVGCGRRAEEQQQYCWKHLMELKQGAMWQQGALVALPTSQQLDNQRLEELATAALLPQDRDSQALVLATQAGASTSALARPTKPRAKRSRRRGALVLNLPTCSVPNCRREARPESAEGLCSFHAPKRPRGRPDAPPCAEPDCRKKARLCADGQMLYCLEHLQGRGLVPRAVSCGFPGCTKSSVPNMDGQRLYCTAHTRARGLRPRVVACTMPGCMKVAQPSVDGQRLYCVSHMRQHGMVPKTGGCRHEGCNKVAKLATDGQLNFCIAHMRVNGLAPKVAVCSYQGCTKVAKASTNGQSQYCIAHMREYGLEPKVPACQHPGCPKVAKTSNDGQHLYCIAHMRERGLSPRMATCHHPACQELAAPAANKRCIYCKAHMPLYGLMPKEMEACLLGDAEQSSVSERALCLDSGRDRFSAVLSG